MCPLRLTVLSNGHGEDAIGAALLSELARQLPDAQLFAYPTVDLGEAYAALPGVALLEPRRQMPSGGLLIHHPKLFWQDLRAGFVQLTAAQLATLRRHTTDALVVIGDLYALALSSLVRTRQRFYYQSLVSAHHRDAPLRHPLHRLAMERLTPPERALMRRLCHTVYVRDAATATYLHARGVAQAKWLGNPVVDAVAGAKPLAQLDGPLRLALLPGSRRYRARALALMAAALAQLPEVQGYLAWTGGALPELAGWRFAAGGHDTGLIGHFVRGPQRIWVYEGRFAAVLASCQLALGTAGTAHEQAAALGRPVVSFPLPPDYTRAFLANQQRLLGAALSCCPAEPQAIAQVVRQLLSDPAAYARAAAAGRARMGPPGGTAAIAADIARALVKCATLGP